MAPKNMPINFLTNVSNQNEADLNISPHKNKPDKRDFFQRFTVSVSVYLCEISKILFIVEKYFP